METFDDRRIIIEKWLNRLSDCGLSPAKQRINGLQVCLETPNNDVISRHV